MALTGDSGMGIAKLSQGAYNGTERDYKTNYN